MPAEVTGVSDQTATTSQPAQGWYTDPHDAARLRWWDGSTWTDHVHDASGDGAAANGSGTAATSGRSGNVVATSGSSKPGRGSAPASGGERSAVSAWLSVRSNQILLAVLIVAIALFAFVMLGAGA